MINAVGQGLCSGNYLRFFSPVSRLSKTHPRCSHQRRSGANWEQLTQAVGEGPQLKQKKRELMKNKQITAHVNQGRWSNYKHCGGIPKAVVGVGWEVLNGSKWRPQVGWNEKNQKNLGGSSDKVNQSSWKRRMYDVIPSQFLHNHIQSKSSALESLNKLTSTPFHR